MNTESYFNHPTFGMLFSICKLEDQQELFTTLYAQRLFFVVTNNMPGMTFESITRTDARIKVENRLRQLRRISTASPEFQTLQTVYKRTFQ